MSKDNNIEGKFNKVFNGDIPTEPWNTPDDALWPEIETAINKPNDRYSIWPFAFLLLFCLAGSGLWLINSQLQSTKQKLAEKEIELQMCGESQKQSEAVIPLIDNNNEQSAVVTEVSELPSDEVANTAAIPVQSSTDTAVTTIGKAHNSGGSESHTTPTGSINNGKHRVVKATYIASEVLELPQRSTTDFTPLQGLSPMVTGHSDRLAAMQAPTLEVMPVVEPIKNSKATYFNIAVMDEYGYVKSDGMQETPLTELIDAEYGRHSIGVSAFLQREVSQHWYINAGIGYSHQRYNTNYDLELGYELADEKVQGSEGHVSYEHSLPSFVGNLDTELILGRSLANSIGDNETVQLDFDTRTSIHQLSLPIGIEYYTGANRSGLSLGLQVRPSYIVAASSSIHAVTSYHDHIDDSFASSTLDQSGFEQLQLHVGLGLGYTYPLAPGTSITVGASYLRGLTNLYTTQTYSSSSDVLITGITLSTRL